MIRIERVHRLEPIAIDEAFDYVVDFSHIDDWDRGVASASRLEGTGVEVGARFEVMSLFFGRTVPLVYEITESLPPDRAVLKTRSRRFDAADTIELTAAGSTAAGSTATTIRYTAEFRFRGVMRVLGAVAAPLAYEGRRAGTRGAGNDGRGAQRA